MKGYKPKHLAVEDFAVLYLFSYIHNPILDKYEKIENLIKWIIEKPKFDEILGLKPQMNALNAVLYQRCEDRSLYS